MGQRKWQRACAAAEPALHGIASFVGRQHITSMAASAATSVV